MHNTTRYIPASNLVHCRFKLIKMMIVQMRRLLGRAIDRICRLHMQLHGSQRSTVMSIHQQGGRQFISNIMLVRQLAKVAFRSVIPIIKLAPIVYQKHEIRRAFGGGIPAWYIMLATLPR